MFEYKLQVGCIILLLYCIANYMRDSADKKIHGSGIFKAMLVVAPWAVVFDGVTAYTVNHMDTVPEWVNFVCHGVFFFLMCIMTVLVFLYMIDQMMNPSVENLRKLATPGILATIATLVTMGSIEFIRGETTNYSLGIPVYICFVSLFAHYLLLLGIIIYRKKTIEKKKVFSLISIMVVTFALLLAQLLLPEILLTAILPTIMVIGLYINFEDPSLKRIKTYNSDIVAGFATMVESRDDNTGGHINRTREYVRIILDGLETIPKYRQSVTGDYLNNVLDAAALHDVGKIATPDNILLKPGKLTTEEFGIMKQHTVVGGEIIQKTLADLDEPEYLNIAYEVARYHHEKWNGKGYPEGLKGENIPLHARIMAIADVFDAVSAKRCYRDAIPLERCFRIIEEGSGVDFDPELVKLFMNSKARVIEYYALRKLSDSDLKVS